MPQAGEVGAEALEDVLEVAVRRRPRRGRSRRRSAVGGASSSASISSSAASVSLRPSRSKNLTPLYSGGLCEAEMTTPRSSASSATAGVGSTPASTALPPAEATPRANASSSSRPEPRVSRPTKTRAAARPERRGARRAARRARGQVLADDASDAVGPEVAARHEGEVSAWRTGAPCAPCAGRPSCARRCARRASRKPSRLSADAQLGIGLDERAGDPVADGAGLAARAAAVHAHADVVRALDAGDAAAAPAPASGARARGK